jgi:hypothetical protein
MNFQNKLAAQVIENRLNRKKIYGYNFNSLVVIIRHSTHTHSRALTHTVVVF